MRKTTRRTAKKAAVATANETPAPPILASIFTHDTPPPTEILDGSLAVGMYRPLTRETPSGGRFFYDKGINVDAGIAHIKVARGNGEIIYQNLDAQGSTITIDLEKTTGGSGKFASVVISVATVAGGSVFRIDSTHKLPYQTAAAGTQRRPFKYSHPGPGGNNQFRVSKITITNADHQFMVTAPASLLPEEYRVMIWHEGD